MESNIYLYLTHTIELLDRFEAYLDTNCANPDVFKKEIKENNELSEGSYKYCPEAIENFEAVLSFRKFLAELIIKAKLAKNNTSIVLMHYLVFQITDTMVCPFFRALMKLMKPRDQTTIVRFLTAKDTLVSMVVVANTVYDIHYVEDDLLAQFKQRQGAVRGVRKALRDHHLFEQCKYVRPLTIPIEKKVHYQTHALKTQGSHDLFYKECDSKTNLMTNKSIENTYRPKTKQMSRCALLKEGIKVQRQLEKEKLRNHKKVMLEYEASEANKFACATGEKSDKFQKVIQEIEKERLEQSKPAKYTPPSSTGAPIKTNVATILRTGARIKKNLEKANNLVNALSLGAADPNRIGEMFAEIYREQREADMQEIERKHLAGLLNHEDARLARIAVKKAVEVKASEFRRAKDELNLELQIWKEKEIAKLKLQISENRTSHVIAKITNELRIECKKDNVRLAVEEAKFLRQKAEQERLEELEKKAALIRQIREYELLRRITRVERVFDKEETAGLGLMCEMSIAQLNTSLEEWKVRMKKERLERRQVIAEERKRQLALVGDTLDMISKHSNIKKPVRTSPYSESLCESPNDKLREELMKKRQLVYSLTNYGY